MPERKRFFFIDVFPYFPNISSYVIPVRRDKYISESGVASLLTLMSALPAAPLLSFHQVNIIFYKNKESQPFFQRKKQKSRENIRKNTW